MTEIYAIDFEYDGIRLGNLGYLICRFDGGGLETVSNGSQITFNKISMQRGDRWELASTEYSECLQATFQICKNPCMVDDMYMSLQEVSKLTSWLNRKDFHKLKFFTDEYYDLYFEASFNVSRIELNNVPVGLELTMETKSPYALHDPEIINIESDSGIVSFNVNGIFSQDVAYYLNKYNICVRAGNHCAKILKSSVGIENSARISLYFYNTYEEIDALVELLSDYDKIVKEMI